MDVAPGKIIVFSDIGCPWAHVAVARLHAARERLGLVDEVRFDHRAFVLELANERSTPWRVLQGEIPVTAALEPGAGWQVWRAAPWEWPVSTLLALEAVQAAKQQSLRASETLDRALRRALFAESRCITMRHVVLDAAARCDGIDADALSNALDEGRFRKFVVEQWRGAAAQGVKGSPHLFLPDGRDLHNPGIEMHTLEGDARGFPVVDRDDPALYLDVVKRAALGQAA
jgi:predicted DsbA family dithiol-disulfide isomerase